MTKKKDPEIMDMLTQWQKFVMCTWGMNRRYKYFDFIHAGYDQRTAFRKAREMSKKELRSKFEQESIEGKTWRNREFDKKIGA